MIFKEGLLDQWVKDRGISVKLIQGHAILRKSKNYEFRTEHYLVMLHGDRSAIDGSLRNESVRFSKKQPATDWHGPLLLVKLSKTPEGIEGCVDIDKSDAGDVALFLKSYGDRS